ncbi:MAG: M23 family metallopeptidase [Cyanobacteria bacterium P01_A01_bin.135]
MRRSRPQNCTILVTQTGRSPLMLSIRPVPLIISLMILAAAPLVWLSNQIYQLREENLTLLERNSDLSEAASDAVAELNQLDAEIDRLEERAGLPEADAADESDLGPRGGIPAQLEPEEMIAAVEHHLPSLSLRLHQQVKPALTSTLEEEEAKEAALPVGRPVKGGRISSKFGTRRNPFGRGYELHNGIDFPGPTGTPIYVTGKGTIEKAMFSRGYGNHIVVDHGYGYQTLYAHLSKMDVTKGDTVERGAIIGRMGSTGRSTGPHLHYTLYYQGDAVNPEDFLSQDSEP